MNVGTIGHIDHGKITLSQALVRSLGEDMASKVVLLDEEGVARARRDGFIRDDLDEAYAQSSLLSGRPRNTNRKAKRKARLLELQRRAFLKNKS